MKRPVFAGIGPYVRRHTWRWVLAIVALLPAVGGSLAGPRLIGSAIDDLRAGRPPGGRLGLYALMMVLAAAISGAAYVAVRRLNAGASRRVSYEIRRDVVARLMLLEPDYYHRARTGDLMSRLTGDVNAVQEMLGFALTQVVNTAFTLLFVLTMMLRLSPTLGALVLLLFPVIVGLLALLLRVIARRYASAQEQQSLVAARAQENFSGARVVKGYAAEERELVTYTGLMAEHRRRVLALARVEGPLWATVGVLIDLVFAAVLVIGGRQLLLAGPDARVGGLTLGGFVTFVTYLYQLAWPLLSVGVMANAIQRGAVSWERLRTLLTVEPAVRDGAETDPAAAPLAGALRFEHVSLVREGKRLLDDVTLDVPRGAVVGITGATGGGKTLLASLVPRLLDPSTGRVLLDGRDARRMPLATLRRGIGFVPQEPFLFSATLAENIGFGLPESTQTSHPARPDPAVIRWAAHVAALESDVATLADGYDTVLGERGVTLSGGQRQRTAIARAVAGRPPILVLDDALSAVDTETEATILKRLRTELAGHTVLLIAHRVSTLRHADEVVVLEQGRVVERGTHAELLAQGGRYAELDRKQRLASRLDEPTAAPVPPASGREEP